MIGERVSFLNRERELARIAECLQDWNTESVICIQGPGGIGKTRLMQEVSRRFATLDQASPLLICDIIDFDNIHFHMPQNVGREIAHQLGRERFRPYLNALRDARLAEQKGAPKEYMTRKIQEANQAFVDSFNAVSERKRVVLRFDTTDALKGTQTLDYMLSIALDLQNTLLLFAGRNAKEVYDKVGQETDTETTLLLLGPFETSIGKKYLIEKQQGVPFDLDPEWVEKLLILSGGYPILVDMAFDWAARNVPITWVQDIELSELQRLADNGAEGDREELAVLRKRFRYELVTPIKRIESDTDQLILTLAKIHPLDLEGIATLLSISEDHAQELYSRAQKWTIIKVLPDGRIKLHDEVQRMVNRYVWPEIDPEGRRERRDMKRAISYLTANTEELLDSIESLRQEEKYAHDHEDSSKVLELFGERMAEERQLWSLKAERLRRALRLDIQRGYEWFLKDYQEQERISGSRQYRDVLIAQVQPYVDELSQEQRLCFQRIRARHLTDDGNYELASEVYQKLLAEIPEQSTAYIEALVGQGNLLLRVGEIPSAFDDFRKALHLSEKLANKGWVAKSLLALGYAHHLSGQLDEASEYYRDAYLQSIEIDDKERQALALNSIAHVFAIQSREHDALGTVQQAIELWKELISESEEHRFRLGQSYNTTGEIYVELDQPERSLPYFELAWNIFDRVEGVAAEEVEQAIEWKSRTRSGRGFARWMLGDLESARQDLEWAEQHATAGDMPSILHRLSHVHWDLKERGKAEAGWRESMRKARAVGDMFTEFNSLTDLARIAFERQIAGFDHWHDFGTWYENYCRRYSYPRFTILEGLLNVYMGNLALRADEIEPATDLYLEGLPLLVQAGTYADFNIDGQLESIEERVFPSIPVKSIRQVGEVLLAGWPRETSYVAALNYFRRWKGWTRKAAEPLEAGE